MVALAAVLPAQVLLLLLDLMALHNLLLLVPKEVLDGTLASMTPPAVRQLLAKQLLAHCPSNSLIQSTQSLLLDCVNQDKLSEAEPFLAVQVCNQPRPVVPEVLNRIALLALELQLLVQLVRQAYQNQATALNLFLFH